MGHVVENVSSVYQVVQVAKNAYGTNKNSLPPLIASETTDWFDSGLELGTQDAFFDFLLVSFLFSCGHRKASGSSKSEIQKQRVFPVKISISFTKPD